MRCPGEIQERGAITIILNSCGFHYPGLNQIGSFQFQQKQRNAIAIVIAIEILIRINQGLFFIFQSTFD